MIPYKHFFFTVKKSKQGRNIKVAMALEGDRVIYCRGRLRNKFVIQFEDYEARDRYGSLLFSKSGVDNMICERFEGVSK